MSLRPPAGRLGVRKAPAARAIRMPVAPSQAGMALEVAAGPGIGASVRRRGLSGTRTGMRAVSDQQRWHHGRGRLQPKLPMPTGSLESTPDYQIRESGVGLPNPDSGKSGVGSRESKREFRSLHHGAAGALTPMSRRDRQSPFTGIPTQTTLPGRRRLRLRPRPPRPGQPLPTSDLIHAHIVSIARKQQLSRG